jgi:hypothetical protein
MGYDDNLYMMLNNFGNHKTAVNEFGELKVGSTMLGLDATTLKLSLVLLAYLFSKDRNISANEQIAFDTFIQKMDVLSELEKEEYVLLLKQLPTLDYVVRYVIENELTYNQVMAAINFLNNEVKIDKKDSASLVVVKYKCEKLLK